MIEKGPLRGTPQKEAEYALEVAKVIRNDPSSIIRPLKYHESSLVLFQPQNTMAEVIKRDAGVYLLRLKTGGEEIICKESDLATIH